MSALDELAYDNFAYKHSSSARWPISTPQLSRRRDVLQDLLRAEQRCTERGGGLQTRRAVEASAQVLRFHPAPGAAASGRFEGSRTKGGASRDHERSAGAHGSSSNRLQKLAGNAPDQDGLQILSSILQGGNSSRLYQKLTKEKELVVDVGGFLDRRIGPSALLIGATVRPDRKVEDVEAAIYAEIEQLQKQPVSDLELERAKNAARLGYLQQIRGSQTRATLLGMNTVKYNDPNLINTRLDRMNAVTAADVQRVAQRYLQASNRTVVIATPAGG